MQLLVMRHGEAGEAGHDFDRELTNEGVEGVVRVRARLAEKSVDVAAVVSSPLVRARQTAEIAGVLFPSAEHLTWREISPDGECLPVHAALLELGEPALLVSHQPFVSMLIEHLTGQSIAMRPASIAAIDMDSGTLEWLLEC